MVSISFNLLGLRVVNLLGFYLEVEFLNGVLSVWGSASCSSSSCGFLMSGIDFWELELESEFESAWDDGLDYDFGPAWAGFSSWFG